MSKELLGQRICEYNLFCPLNPGVAPFDSFEMEGDLKVYKLMSLLVSGNFKDFTVNPFYEGIERWEGLEMSKENFPKSVLGGFSRLVKITQQHLTTPTKPQRKSEEVGRRKPWLIMWGDNVYFRLAVDVLNS